MVNSNEEDKNTIQEEELDDQQMETVAGGGDKGDINPQPLPPRHLPS